MDDISSLSGPLALLPDGAPPQTQFTRPHQVSFIRALSECGNVRAAARACRISAQTAYRLRRSCPEFALAWNCALLAARAEVEAILADRAINGIEETVFYHGEEIATRRRYDSRLLLAHLARLDRLSASGDVRFYTRRFDRSLADYERTGRIRPGEDRDYDDEGDFEDEDFDEAEY